MHKTLRHFWLLLIGLVSTLAAHRAEASHAIGSDMNYINVGPGIYFVNYRFYRDCSGITVPQSFQLTYSGIGCGAAGTGSNAGGTQTLTRRSYEDGNPYCASQNSQSPCDTASSISSLFPNYQVYTYGGIVTLGTAPNQQCSEWTLLVSESARPDLANIDLANASNLVSFIRLNNRDTQTDSSPAFSIAAGFKPLIFACAHSHLDVPNAVVDPDGDSLVYSLAPAYTGNPGAGTTGQASYINPYTPTNPVRTDPATPPTPDFAIDPINGTISFTAGAYVPVTSSVEGDNKFVVVVQVEAYSLINGVRVKTSTARRDILVVIFDCPNPPVPPQPGSGDSAITNVTIDSLIRLGVDDTIIVDACASSKIDIPIYDLNGDSIYVAIDQSQLPGNNAVLQQISQTISGTLTTLIVRLIWTPDAATINTSYPVTLSIRDNGCPIQGLTTLNLTLKVIKDEFADVGLQTQAGSGDDDTVCLGQSTRLVAATQRPATFGFPPQPAQYTYVWHPNPGIISVNGAEAIVRPLRTTRFLVDVVSPQGCVDTASTVIVVDSANYGTAAAVPDTTCRNGIVQLQATPRARTIGPDGSPITYSYRWAADPTLSADTIQNPIARPFQTTRYRVTISSSLGCTDTASVVVMVDPNNVASIRSTSVNDSVCRSGYVELRAIPRLDSVAEDGTPIVYTYRWMADSTVMNADTTLSNDSIQAIVVRPFQTTRYFVTVYSSAGCTDTASTVIYVDPANVARAAARDNVSAGNVVCPGIGGKIVAIPRRETTDVNGDRIQYTYQWAPTAGLQALNGTDSTAIATLAGGEVKRFFVTVFSSAGCTDTASIVLRADFLPEFPVADSVITQELAGNELQLNVLASNDTLINGTPRFTYEFFPSTGLSNANIYNPVVNGNVVTTNTRYEVLITNENGCDVQRSVIVTVKIGVPNVITPNGDQYNEKFELRGISSNLEVMIFNRWGRKVHEWKKYDNSWDGKDDAPGTYYYQIIDHANKDKSYRGWVEVIK